MSLNITIDINGQVIERIAVQQTLKLDDDPGGRRGYTVTELNLGDEALPHTIYRNIVRHRRKDGALHLAAKVCEYLSVERRKR